MKNAFVRKVETLPANPWVKRLAGFLLDELAKAAVTKHFGVGRGLIQQMFVGCHAPLILFENQHADHGSHAQHCFIRKESAPLISKVVKSNGTAGNLGVALDRHRTISFLEMIVDVFICARYKNGIR